MPLILAIEPDRRQAARITALARERLHAELLVTDSAEHALTIVADRVPDVILTSLLLSPKDEALLDERLRELDASGAHVQTLMIPVLASSGRRAAVRDGLLDRLRRPKGQPAPEGCDPAVFAAQIAVYLDRAAHDRAELAAMAGDEPSVLAEHEAEAEAGIVACEFTVIDELSVVDVPSVDVDAGEHWDELLLEADADLNLTISAEPIDLVAFVEELARPAMAGATGDPDLDVVNEIGDDWDDEPDPAFDDFTDEGDLWMPLPMAAARQWPPLEGPMIRATFVPAFDAPADPGVEFAAPALSPDARADASKGRVPGRKRTHGNKPAQDEWGFFDPLQCGFAALLAKLNEVTDLEDPSSDSEDPPSATHP